MRLVVIKDSNFEVVCSFVEPLTLAKLAKEKLLNHISLKEADDLVTTGQGETYSAHLIDATTLG